MIPFRRVIRQGTRGPDVEAVKLGMQTVGETGFALSRYQGVYAVRALQRYQGAHGLHADGVYGPKTHALLSQHFSPRAVSLYLQAAPTLELPERFTPTHSTSGLAGVGSWPLMDAIDVLAKPGTVALAPASGTIDKLSGRPPSGATTPGGAYGLSCYLKRSKGGRYFLTHFGSLIVGLGQAVKKGQPIGTVVDFEKATHGITPSHIHEGFNPNG